MGKLSLLAIMILVSGSVFSQPAFTFTGNGNWADTSNWLNGSVPPASLLNGTVINITPPAEGECILNVPIRIPAGVQLNVLPGKKLKVSGDFVVSYDSTVVLKDNVHIVDTNTMVSNSTLAMLHQGIYEYTYSTAPPMYNVGDILIGPLQGGYIRKITSLAINGNTITFQTDQASMEHVFKQGAFHFSIGTDSLLSQRPAQLASNDYSYSFHDITLYNEGSITIKLNNGNITLNPNWLFDFDFQNLKIKNFELGCENASLTSTFEVGINATQATTLFDKTDTLKRVTKTFTKWLLVYGVPVPVVVVMNLDFICKYSAVVDASVSRDITFSSINDFSLAVKYANNTWTPVYNFNGSKNVRVNSSTGNANATINLAIIPTFSFQLYGITGPYVSVGLHEQLKANVASPALDWNFSAGAWLQTTLGANAEAFGESLFDYNRLWDTDTLFYKTPYRVSKISGDNQNGDINQHLAVPVKVRVLDQLGNKQANVPVYFAVTAGGGMVQPQSLLSDADGYAQAFWQTGNLVGVQRVTATAKNADGTLLQDAPVQFSASIATDSTFIDPRDGQAYKFRHIGSQVWMTQNLNYNIPGSFCYENADSNCAIYGRLYQWDAAVAAVPAGWHLPSNEEWGILFNYLGSEAGGAMKSTSSLWRSPNVGATNSSGFSGLPGGASFSNGEFFDRGNWGGFWSSTENGSATAFMFYLHYSSAFHGANNPIKSSGYYVRYVRD